MMDVRHLDAIFVKVTIKLWSLDLSRYLNNCGMHCLDDLLGKH